MIDTKTLPLDGQSCIPDLVSMAVRHSGNITPGVAHRQRVFGHKMFGAKQLRFIFSRVHCLKGSAEASFSTIKCSSTKSNTAHYHTMKTKDLSTDRLPMSENFLLSHRVGW